MEWKYLEAPVFQWRCILAAHMVKDCPNVLEVGSYATPITRFLVGQHKQVWVVDPKLGPDRFVPDNVEHALFLDIPIQQLMIEDISRPYALIMLGMEIKGDLSYIFPFVDSAELVVIEHTTDWQPSIEQFGLICQHTDKRVAMHADLDFSGNDLGDMSGSYPPRLHRRIIVLR